MSVLSFILLAVTGCKTTKTERHFIYLSDNVVTFQYTGNNVQTITVESNPEWTSESYVNWLTVDNVDGNAVITVQDNTGDIERNATVTLHAGQAQAQITVIQLGDDSLPMKYDELYELHSAAISPSGTWIGGYYSVPDPSTGLSMAYMVFIEVATGDRTEFGPYPESIMLPTSVNAVSDLGNMYLYCNGGMMGISKDEQNYFIPNFSGHESSAVQISQFVEGSEDWAGYVQDGSTDYMYTPVVCRDGVIEELPLTELSFREQPHSTGAMARGISADGSIIYGSTWENFDMGAIYWDREGVCHFIGEETDIYGNPGPREVTEIQRPDGMGGTEPYKIVNGATMAAETYNISPSGTWIACTWRTETPGDENNETINEANYPCFFNTETKQTFVLTEFGDGAGLSVTDDGIGFIGSPSSATSMTTVWDIEANQSLGSFNEWLQANYGINYGGGYVMYARPDRNFFWGARNATAIHTPNWYVAGNPDKL